jgi:DNA replication protein DnaC
LKLRRLNNEEFERAEEKAASSGIPLDECPTCGSKVIEVEPAVYGRENGQYRYFGETYDCDCDTQMALRKHYLLANIGDQYMRLNWDDFDGDKDLRGTVKLYLNKFDSARRNGMGVEFASKELGTGKTFAATHIAKELIKRGESVYFIPFTNMISLYATPGGQELEEQLKKVAVLVLDEVVPPDTGAQHALFARRFEELIRHRTNFNLPIIMTTNMNAEELHDEFPRVYSLLEAKQLRVKVKGYDARAGRIGMENLELLANDEVRPIT